MGLTLRSSAYNKLLLATNIFLICCISSFALAAIYRLTHLVNGSEWDKIVLIFYSCSILVLSALFALRGEVRINVSLALIATYSSVFIINFFLVLTLSAHTSRNYAKAAKASGVAFDTRDKLQVIQDLRKSGRVAYPPVTPTFWYDRAIHPLSGISNVLTVFCNENGQYPIYKSDRYGFNNDDAVYSSDKRRIILLGDSYAHGACVEQGQETAGVLRKLGYAAISLSAAGGGPLYELSVLVEYGKHLKPDVVLWAFHANSDLTDLEKELKHPTFQKYYFETDFTQNLINRQNETDQYWKQYLFSKEKEKLEGRLKRDTHFLEIYKSAKDLVTVVEMRKWVKFTGAKFTGGRRLYFDRDDTLVTFQNVLKRAADITSKWGGRFYFVYLPSWEHFSGVLSSPRSFVLPLVRELNIPVIDFEKKLLSTGDPLGFFPFRIAGHYTPQGYSLLAQQIALEALDAK